MDQIQVLAWEFENHPHIANWSKLFDIKFINNWTKIDPAIPIVTGSDLTNEHVKVYLNTRQPALYIGRGYCGNHTSKHRRLWRVSMNSWGNTILKTIPYSRWNIMNLPRHSWKVKKIRNVLIAPSRVVSKIWTQQTTTQWAESMLDKFPGAEVKIRYKLSTPGERYATLWNDLDWADLVVTQCSAITCEALWYGKKPISLVPCPTWAAGRTSLENWDDPSEPEFRDQWHEHLAWSQYTSEEWASGEAFSLIHEYLGPIHAYDPCYSYNFILEANP